MIVVSADEPQDDDDDARLEQQAAAILAKFDTTKLTAPFRNLNLNLIPGGLSKALVDHSSLLKSFQASASASHALSKLAADQSQWLQAMQRAMPSAATFAKLAESNIGKMLADDLIKSRPSNFAGLRIAEQRAVIEVACSQSVGIVETLSAERLKELAQLDSREAADSALADWADEFGEICQRVASLTDNNADALPREHSALLTAAADALGAGHPAASQALSTLVWDSHCERRFGRKPIRKVKPRSHIEFEESTMRQFYFRAAYGPLVTAYTTSDQSGAYSRNITVHGAAAMQFTRANAVRALSCALGAVAHVARWPETDGATWGNVGRTQN